MAAFDIAALRTASIHTPPSPALPVTFAATELQSYLEKLTGWRVPLAESATLNGNNVLVVSTPSEGSVSPAAAGSPDGELYALQVEERRLTLAGTTPRALLDAVYALLEHCGCRWSWYGPQEETVPRITQPTLAIPPLRATAPFAVRGYATDIMTWHYTQPEQFNSRLADDQAFIDWMAKTGANAFCFIRHPFDSLLTIAELVPEFQRRGIGLEYGGHVMPLLLPRSLYGEHPEYFPESPDGGRSEYGNLCSSSTAALATASANAVQYIREYPEMTVLHLWGADLWRGGWCYCSACKGRSAQDQSLLTCNAVAGALADAGLARPVCYLAYHDTIDADLTMRPDEHVVVEFAPRERCYGHALNDPQCATNRRYAEALERYVGLFDGRVRLFEYYADAILFCGATVPLTEVIAADLEHYRRLGVPEITMLQFGTYSLWAYPLNFLTFADGARAPLQSSTPSRMSGCEAYWERFGSLGGHARAQLAHMEAIMRDIVTYGDIRRPPRDAGAAAILLPRVVAALPKLAMVEGQLEGPRDVALSAHAALVRYTRLLLDGVRQELQASVEGRSPHREGRYTAALQVIESVDQRFKGLWGTVDLPIIHAFHDVAAGGP